MAGVPDGLERLWTPHRLAYVSGAAVPAAAKADGAAPEGCPFCRIQRQSDEDGLVIARGGSVFAMLNLYPYNPGHLMVLPYRHVADYPDLTPAETVELAEFTQTAMRVVRRVSSPHGFNLGMNQGAVAGAGIAAHLHQHVVPRWGGDTNFMPVIGRTKTVPQLLGDTRQLLAEAWAATARPSDGAVPGRPSRRRILAPAAATSTTPEPATARSAPSKPPASKGAAKPTPSKSAVTNGTARSTPSKSPATNGAARSARSKSAASNGAAKATRSASGAATRSASGAATRAASGAATRSSRARTTG